METTLLNSTRTRRIRREISAEFKELARRARAENYPVARLLKLSNAISHKDKYAKNLRAIAPAALGLPIRILAKYADSMIRVTYNSPAFINTILISYSMISDQTLLQVFTTVSLGNLAFLFLKTKDPQHRACSLGILQRIRAAIDAVAEEKEEDAAESPPPSPKRKRRRPSSA